MRIYKVLVVQEDGRLENLRIVEEEEETGPAIDFFWANKGQVTYRIGSGVNNVNSRKWSGQRVVIINCSLADIDEYGLGWRSLIAPLASKNHCALMHEKWLSVVGISSDMAWAMVESVVSNGHQGTAST